MFPAQPYAERGERGADQSHNDVRLGIVLALAFGGIAGGGPCEDATAAYAHGDYATARKLPGSLADRSPTSMRKRRAREATAFWNGRC